MPKSNNKYVLMWALRRNANGIPIYSCGLIKKKKKTSTTSITRAAG